MAHNDLSGDRQGMAPDSLVGDVTSLPADIHAALFIG